MLFTREEYIAYHTTEEQGYTEEDANEEFDGLDIDKTRDSARPLRACRRVRDAPSVSRVGRAQASRGRGTRFQGAVCEAWEVAACVRVSVT